VPDCFEPVINVAANWSDQFVVQAFGNCLRRIARPENLPFVEKTLAGDNSNQRQVATSALPSLLQGQPLRDRLLDLTRDEDDLVRLTAAEQLADLGDSACLPVLFELLRSQAISSRVIDDLQGLLGHRVTGTMTVSRWQTWREQNPGSYDLRYPVTDAVVVYKLQAARGRVAVMRGEKEEVQWYSQGHIIPAGPLRAVGVELSSTSLRQATLLKSLRQADHIRRVSFAGSAIRDSFLNELRDMFRLTHLDLSGCTRLTDAGLVSLTRLPALEELDLSGTNITARGLRSVAQHQSIRKLSLKRCRSITDAAMATVTNLLELRELNLDETRVTGEGLRTLSRLDQLRILVLGREIDDRALQAAAGLPLETLHLNYSRVTDAGLKHVSSLKHLRTLWLYRCPRVNDLAVQHLQDLPALEDLRLTCPNVTNASLPFIGKIKNLKTLSLYDSRITGEKIDELAGLKKLTTLDLGRTSITEQGMSAISKLVHLESLNLRTTPVDDRTVKQLASLKRLKVLNLESTRVLGTSLIALADAPITELRMHNARLLDSNIEGLRHLKELRILDVSNTQLSNSALKVIGRLSKLEQLDLSRTSIDDKGLEHLKQLKSLREIRIRLTGITSNGIAALAAELPGLTWRR